MWHRLVCKKFTDVSDERIASNFMVKWCIVRSNKQSSSTQLNNNTEKNYVHLITSTLLHN
jgi:hypothetical protein